MRRAFDVSAGMLRQAMKPTSVISSALISACEKVDEMLRALDNYAGMLRQVAMPDAVRYTAFLRACEKGK